MLYWIMIFELSVLYCIVLLVMVEVIVGKHLLFNV